MNRDNLTAFLRNSGVVSPDQAVEIAGFFQHRPFGKNEVLLQVGRLSDAYLFVDSGLLRAFVHDDEGNDITTGFYSGRQVALEASSFFNRTPAQESIQALTDGEGWFITFEQLNGLFHARPEFREFGRSVLVRTITTLKSRLLDQVRQSATARYAKLLHDSPEVLLHAPLKQIATFLGVTDSSLSRIRAGVKV